MLQPGAPACARARGGTAGAGCTGAANTVSPARVATVHSTALCRAPVNGCPYAGGPVSNASRRPRAAPVSRCPSADDPASATDGSPCGNQLFAMWLPNRRWNRLLLDVRNTRCTDENPGGKPAAAPNTTADTTTASTRSAHRDLPTVRQFAP